jgi:nitrite reductase (NO-forming)
MKRLMMFVTILALALVLVACGGGEDEAETASLTFEGTDSLQFSPATASVPAGAEVTVNFNNTGALEHSWTLVANDADVATVTDANAINSASTGSVAGGASDTVTFTAPSAGTYKYVCTIPGHAAGGMVGTLTVN